jgi:hypothetical protein
MRQPIATIGPYLLGRVLGRGGMGVVHEGTGPQGERVAVKLLHPGGGATERARLRKEAQALRRLQHPGIATVLDVISLQEDGAVLVMEFIDGASLRQHLAAGPPSVPLAVRWAGQVAAALEHAHAAGVVHRDIKPENIMLAPDPGGGPEAARVLDFGVARVAPLADTGGTHTRLDTAEGVTLGTLRYMAPEQLLCPQVDGKADVFSLGAVLYEMLAGAPPYGAEVPDLSLTAPAPPPPSAPSGAVPRWLADLVLAMLAKDPAARPTMAQAAAALSQPRTGRGPFPGLMPFTEEEAPFFHGRERDVEAAVGLLGSTGLGGPGQAGYRRWLQIEGASGSGKSSFLLAGLLPAWRRAGISGQVPAVVLLLRPGREPLLNLAQALLCAWPQLAPLSALLGRLREADGLRLLLREVCRPGQVALLAIDPFEEVLTLWAEDREGPAALDGMLDAALGDVDGPLHLTTALRSDFLGQLALLPRLERRLNQAARYHLPPMDGPGLREALLGPCARAGLRLEPGLAARVVADTEGLAGCLPLLGHALRAVYEDRSGDLLTLAAYERIGGAAGALAQATEELLRGLGEDGRRRARRALLSLVRIGRGVEDTRRPRSLQEVLAAAGGDAEAERVLLRLSGGRDPQAPGWQARAPVRLLVIDGEKVELIHEALLRHVQALRAWVEEDRRLLERREDLEAAASSWQAMGCPREGLVEGAALGFYEGAGLPGDAPARMRELASPQARRYLGAARERESRRRFLHRGAIGALALTAAGFAGLGTFAGHQRRRADRWQEIGLGHMKEMLHEVDEELAHLPGTTYSRGKMLDFIRDTLGLLADEWGGGWPIDQVHLAYHIRRADYEMNYGAQERVASETEAARKYLRGMERQAPHSPEGEQSIAKGHLDFGDLLLDQDLPTEALPHLTRAEALLREG